MTACVIPQTGELYTTRDQTMIEVLLMVGHRPKEIRVSEPDRQLEYVFVKEEVWGTVQNVLTGQNLTITLKDWWAARTFWTMNLRHLSSTRDRK